MAENYIYAVARIRSRELSLLNESVISQLTASPGEEECLRILSEKGWGDSGMTGEAMLRGEQKKTWDLIRELVPDRMDLFDVFRLPNDYHNLKAAIKESVIDGEHPGIFAEDGTIPARLLEEAMEQSDYELLPENLREVAREAKETLLTTRDGQL